MHNYLKSWQMLLQSWFTPFPNDSLHLFTKYKWNSPIVNRVRERYKNRYFLLTSGLHPWQRKTKATPCPARGFHPDFSTMRLHNPLRDSKPQSCAARLARARFFAAIKLVKDARQVACGNPLAGINHIHLYFIIFALARFDKNRAVRRRMTNGV